MTDSRKVVSDNHFDVSPEPVRGVSRWRTEIARVFGRGPDSRWGSQLIRIASDMILICDESLEICHHNRAFLKGIGYTQGSFTGGNLVNFFPSEDRDDAIAAFVRLKRGHAAGMRLNATFLTVKGCRQFDVRVVRNRTVDGSFFYYLVARDVTEQLEGLISVEDGAADPLFGHLPVAAWRTDESLRVVQAYGGLWADLGVARERLIGGSLGQNEDGMLPRFLLDIDYSDTLAGMTLNTEVTWNGDNFNATVEPFLDSDGRVVGTIGILRRAKASSRIAKLEPLETPGLSGVNRTNLKTRKVLLEPVAAAISSPASNPRPRFFAPGTEPVSTGLSEATGDLDSVALAN